MTYRLVLQGKAILHL